MAECMILVVEDRPKPRDLVPTDEEKVKLQGSMLAYAGTYTVDGEKVVRGYFLERILDGQGPSSILQSGW
jgi:hypothetical protein